MRRFYCIASVLFTVALTGCQGHQAKVDASQNEYDQLSNQFQKECAAEYAKLPPAPSQKCTQIKKDVADAWNRLQAERAKQ